MPPREAEGKPSIKCVDPSRHTGKTPAYPLTGGKPTPSRCVDCLVTPWKPGMILAGQGRELPRCVWIRGGRTHAPADEPTRGDKGTPPGVWIRGTEEDKGVNEMDTPSPRCVDRGDKLNDKTASSLGAASGGVDWKKA